MVDKKTNQVNQPLVNDKVPDESQRLVLRTKEQLGHNDTQGTEGCLARTDLARNGERANLRGACVEASRTCPAAPWQSRPAKIATQHRDN